MPSRTEDTPMTQEITRVSGVLCWEQRSMTCIRTRDAPDVLISWEMSRVSGALCQELGAETKPGLLILSQMHMYQREERGREGR